MANFLIGVAETADGEDVMFECLDVTGGCECTGTASAPVGSIGKVTSGGDGLATLNFHDGMGGAGSEDFQFETDGIQARIESLVDASIFDFERGDVPMCEVHCAGFMRTATRSRA